MLGTEFQEMLRCIRCAACMNHCPVYGAVGGHAYGWVYPGPMGSVLTPALIGVDKAGHLPNASTFCGKCESVCPVKIPLPKLMRHWREREFERHLPPAGDAQQPGALGLVRAAAGAVPAGDAASARRRSGCSAAGAAGSPSCRFAGGWTGGRDLPAPEGDTFFARYARQQREDARTAHDQGDRARRDPPRPAARAAAGGSAGDAARPAGPASAPPDPRPQPIPRAEQIALFVRNIEKEFGTVARVPDLDAVPDAVADYLAAQNLPSDFVMAPHPELQAIPWSRRPLLRCAKAAPRPPTWSACSTPSPASPRPAR